MYEEEKKKLEHFLQRRKKASKLPPHEQEKWKFEIQRLETEIERLQGVIFGRRWNGEEIKTLVFGYVANLNWVWEEWMRLELKNYPKLVQELKECRELMDKYTKERNMPELIAIIKRYKIINDEIYEKFTDAKYERLGFNRVFEPTPWDSERKNYVQEKLL